MRQPIESTTLTPLQRSLLNDYQQGLPLSATPFADMAEQLGVSEQQVCDTLAQLQQQGAISRVGPVFRTHSIGASTLAAMAVEPAQLEAVAAIVSGFDEVNHNYEREHALNLWFVATAPDAQHLARTLRQIEQRSGHEVIALPMLEDYHIDLGFELQWT
ncbi:MAG: Lrp/AsnC family transcriptional regulator [Gammaproteobacteria bacterium]|nr:Lrp/AsnC family transcriptional regulator [Gammaproteobacteria bacterium]MCW8840847.1 Lrp/AsnC family transcriptional regulator [Gammaproteobacteria bacterium]MCW8958401.1 Lrp/AsnC family transcriptional regulator [Gammaproteobacteria bacterium]MCW8972117.1 Lrp/AsnC family transcriptional regulator [Gammaproteobacteria bacterium]MCW8993630.1 Lrp/AsnC family transcriptional regulator [Gammaproteobacteria bacterium]